MYNMNILCVNGSPKKDISASGLFLEILQKNFINCRDINQISILDAEDIEFISKYKVVIIAFPLYIDGVPSHVLRFMKKIEKISNNISIYIIINCGFIEPHHNKYAVEIVKNWCKRSNFIFSGGIAYGAGPMVQSTPIGKGPNKNIERALKDLAKNIENNSIVEVEYVKPNLPRFLYMKVANISWKIEGKRNGLSKKDLYRELNLY